MKSVIIFGGCGYIGINFAEKLLSQHVYDHIYLADIKEPSDKFVKKKFDELILKKEISFINIDIRKKINVPILKKIDLIVDFAAIHREPGHHENEYFDTNVNGSINICEFAIQVDCKNIIFTSSISVYGGGDFEKNENTIPNPNTPYGKSKLMAEKNYVNWQNNNSEKNILTICRPGVVFGPGENGNVTRLIKAIKKGYFLFVGNKDLRKSGIYIDELIYTLIWVNQNQTKNDFNNIELYNGTFYPCPTIFDYANKIKIVLGIKRNFISIPKIIIKIIINLSSLITKKLSKNSNFHFIRLNKLFRSNYVSPGFLLKKKYKYNFDLEKSFEHWKKEFKQDWDLF